MTTASPWTIIDKQPAAFAGTTYVRMILDKSASMAGLTEATISGFNEWLHATQQAPGDLRFSLTMFATKTEDPVADVPIKDVADLDRTRYVADGHSTALYDAIAHGIGLSEADALGPPQSRVLFVILTDGQENSSQEWNRSRIFDLIKAKEALGNWTFTYLSAHPDAYQDAAKIGMARGNVGVFAADADGTHEAFSRMAHSTRSYSAGATGQSVTFYTDDDDHQEPATPWTTTTPPGAPTTSTPQGSQGTASPRASSTSSWTRAASRAKNASGG